MKTKSPKFKNHKTISRKEFVLDLIESRSGLTIADIAIRMYGEDTNVAKEQVGQTLSSLRKEGIWAYPRKKYGEVIIPRTMTEYRDVIKHVFDEGGIDVRVYRALTLLLEGVVKYPIMIDENQTRINSIEQPIRLARKKIKEIEHKPKKWTKLFTKVLKE